MTAAPFAGKARARPVPASRPTAGARLGPGRRWPFARALGPLLLLLIWQIAAQAGWLNPRTLPSPVRVIETAGELWEKGLLQKSLITSLVRAMTGLVFGIALGVVFALIAGLSRIGEAVIDGPMQIWRATPVLAVIPLAIVWLGMGEPMKITLIAITSMIYIYVNTVAGITSVDSRHVELARTLRLTRFEFIRKVVLPGALPGFLTGLRLAAVISLLVLVAVEQTNSINGLGYMMTNARQNGQVDVIAVGLAIYAALGLITDFLLRALDRRALAWRKTLG